MAGNEGAPDLSPDPSWEACGAPLEVGPGSFVSGDPAGDRLRLAYFRRPSDDALVGRVWFGPGAKGPPGHAHGGSTAAVLDEAMGLCCWARGHAVVAAKIGVEFRRLVPLGTVATIETWIDKVDGKKVHVRGRLSSPAGETFVESTGLFITLGLERFGELRAQSGI
jgi:acyl-coenzyme A thioesterase PaaI-like protein